jgi:hypothetical protein
VPDRIGCRRTLSIYGTIHTVAQWVMLLVPNYWVRLTMFVVMGLSQLKQNICYTWLFSLVHSSNKSVACSVINGWDMATIFVTCAYFQFVSRDWYGLYLFMTVLGTVSLLILVVFIPESPMWLLN